MSNEVPHSPGIAISHMAASYETVEYHHEFILPDLAICGITKLEDFTRSDILHKIGLSQHMIPAFIAEAKQILGLLQEAGIPPRQTRHTLRERIGDGGYQRTDNRVSRTDEVRAAFERASDIAAENNAQIVMVWHLFSALLEIPDTHTRALLAEMGVDVDELREKAAALPMPVSATISPDDILSKLGTDLTEKARADELSPVIGRKREMLQVVKVLGRSKKNCPVLVGAAGVGKTAIAEGLAQRIAVENIHTSIPIFTASALCRLTLRRWSPAQSIAVTLKSA